MSTIKRAQFEISADWKSFQILKINHETQTVGEFNATL